MNKTNIEYLNYTWNPIAMRCTKVSEGCANCWHLGMADRLAKNPALTVLQRATYTGAPGGALEPPYLREDELDAPLKRRTPARIGVQFMGDLFHEDVPDEYLLKVFDVMRRGSHHTYLILTKRPERMRDFCSRLRFDGSGSGRMWLADTPDGKGYRLMGGNGCTGMPWVWLGVTAENQARADERIPILLQIPAAVRFVSVEPMLGPVDFAFIPNFYSYGEGQRWYDPIKRLAWYADMSGYYDGCHCREGIDWVICGSESGPGRRPFDMAWARSIKDQCGSEGVPFFFKQGEVNGKLVKMPELDGQVWDQYPEVE